MIHLEALLDIEYAHAIAPGTPIKTYISGGLVSAIKRSVTDNACGAISISFVFCGETPSFYNSLDALFKQASTQGQSVFAATGDWGAAGLQYSAKSASCVTGKPHDVVFPLVEHGSCTACVGIGTSSMPISSP